MRSSDNDWKVRHGVNEGRFAKGLVRLPVLLQRHVPMRSAHGLVSHNGARTTLIVKEVIFLNGFGDNGIVVHKANPGRTGKIIRPQHDELLKTPSGAVEGRVAKWIPGYANAMRFLWRQRIHEGLNLVVPILRRLGRRILMNDAIIEDDRHIQRSWPQECEGFQERSLQFFKFSVVGKCGDHEFQLGQGR